MVQIKNGVIERYCPVCDCWKEENVENFYRNYKVKNKIAFMSTCKVCRKDRNKINKEYCNKKSLEWFYENYGQERVRIKQWKVNNSEKNREYLSEYQKRDSFKQKKYGLRHKNHDVTKQEWYDCKKFFNFECAYCGLSIEEHWITYGNNKKLGDFHKDHLICNGKNNLSNCVPSCQGCNLSKHTFTINQWYNPENSNYTQDRYHHIYLWIRYDYKKFITKSNKR